MPQRVVDLMLVPRRGGQQVLDAAADGVLRALRQDRALGFEDVDVVRRRQPVKVALGIVLPRFRRTPEPVSAPLVRLWLLHCFLASGNAVEMWTPLDLRRYPLIARPASGRRDYGRRYERRATDEHQTRADWHAPHRTASRSR